MMVEGSGQRPEHTEGEAKKSREANFVPREIARQGRGQF